MRREVLCGLGVLLACARGLLGDDWPQWRGPDRTGVSAETGLLKQWPVDGPRELWSIETPGSGYAAPSVAGGTVYVTGSIGSKTERMGVLYALDLRGKTKWQVEYGAEWGASYEMARTTPTILDGAAYVCSGAGIASRFDVAGGAKVWSVDLLKRFGGKNIRWGIAESPLIVDGKMICHPGGKDAGVAALDCETGRTVWTSKGLSDSSAYCSPMAAQVGSRTLLVTQTEDHIVGLDAAAGAVLWRVAQRNKWAVHPNTPVFLDGKCFVSSGYGFGSHMLDLSPDGSKVTVLWYDRKLDNQFHGVIHVNERLYGASHAGPLLCVAPGDGEVVYSVREAHRGSILYADDRLYVHSEQGGLVQLLDVQPDRYTMCGSFRMTRGSGPHWAHPVVADGTLYIRRGSALVAYDVRAAGHR